MPIREDFVQHVQYESMDRNGRTQSVLLIGTGTQIAERIKTASESALKYGEVASITLRPIAPWSVSNLGEQ